MTRTMPTVLDLVASNLRDLLSLMQDLAECRDVSLRVAPDWPQLYERLVMTGVRCEAATNLPQLEEGHGHDPVLRRLPASHGAVSDTCDMGLELRCPKGHRMALIVLRHVSSSGLARSRQSGVETAGRMARRQAQALVHGPALVAGPVLDLIAHLRETDDAVASPGLSGFLRVLCGLQPAPVEATALRIAGLAQAGGDVLRNRHIDLTAEALSVIETIGLGRIEPAAMTEGWAPPAQEADLPTLEPIEPQPFARVRLIEENFIVAEDVGNPEDTPLWFRPAERAGEGWVPLRNCLSDGWVAIASEIIERTHDVVAEYARMHMLRRRDLPTDEVAEAYELNGELWWLRTDGPATEGRAEGSEDWQRTPVPSSLPQRERSVRAILWLDPGLRERVAADAFAWSARMAQGAQVTPMMAAA